MNGTYLGEFDRETHAYGLATTGGLISTAGIAGFTLGGCVGWLMGRCGLVCDNTVNYDNQVQSASTNTNAKELLRCWATSFHGTCAATLNLEKE